MKKVIGEIIMNNYEFWFIVGSQFLYGAETLRQVAEDARVITQKLEASESIPANCKIVYKDTVKTAEEITQIVKEANYRDDCAGGMFSDFPSGYCRC